MKKVNVNNLKFEKICFFLALIFLVFPPLLSRSKQAPSFNLEKKITVIFTVIIMAIYEEILYRIYLPEQAKKLFNLQGQKVFLMEIIFISIFALSHRYLGFQAVVYAFIMGTVFRLIFCLNKNKLLGSFFVSIIHILNNLIVVFFLK